MRKITIVIICIMLITTFSCIFPIKITIADPPEIPSNPNPENGFLNVSIDADFSWICNDHGPADTLTYDVYLGKNMTPFPVAVNITESKYSPPDILAYHPEYYWRIVARDPNGSSTSGPLWHFMTELENQLPNVPNSPTPSNGTRDVSVNVDLSWLGGDPDLGDSVTYDVYFGTSNSPLIVYHNQSDLSYDPDPLAYNTSYYWRIVAWDDQGATTVGPLWNFTTEINKPPNVPSDPDPSNNSTLVSIDTDLSWTCSDPNGDSIKYDVYFGTSSPPPKVTNNQTDTYYDTGMMNSTTKYYWKIVAWDIYYTSNESPIWNFYTASPSNNPPTIADPNPINGKTDVSISLSILRVTIQDLDGDAFNWTITTSPNIGSSSGTSANNGTKNCSLIVNLAYSKTYTWYVKAYDGIFWTNKSYWFTTVSNGYQEPPQPPQNKKPNASAGGPYTGLVNSEITFDGSKSHDTDGNITTWSWNFGDGKTDYGKIKNHTYTKTGTYQILLTITDDDGATNTDTTTCVIEQLNQPPEKPKISEPTIPMKKNTMYTFTAKSKDPDNNSLQYTFQWGDSTTESRSNGSSGVNCTPVNHSWSSAGRYNITVFVNDSLNETSSKIIIYIDAIQTRGAGYLFDNDGDGIYDAFYSDETHQTVLIQRKGDSYLIDKDGDGNWEYVYNATYGLTSYQEPRKTPGFELVFTFGAIAAVLLISRKRKTL